MLITLAALLFLGLCLGSFINAVVWRTKQQAQSSKLRAKNSKNFSILTGRSQCPSCGHELGARDLVPVLSWLALRGHCRYCHEPISWQYPLVELATALLFIGSYYFWPGGVYGVGEWALLLTWLGVSVGLLALLVYDFKWMLLPNKIIYSTLVVAVAGRLVYLIGFEPHKLRALGAWALSIAVASGIFWFIFMISKGKWIGYGDVRLGLITGTVLANPAKSFLMIFLASILGTLFVLPALLLGKKSATSKLPFGPFLIASTAIVVIFGQTIIDWYNRTFLS